MNWDVIYRITVILKNGAASQGVMLLNSALTVRSGAANSHRNKGWERFTDRVVECLNEKGRIR